MSQVDDAAQAELSAVLAETELAEHEKRKLKVDIARFDGLVLMLCALVGLDTIGAVSSYGAQAIIWLVFLGIFFFVPYAMLCAELGTGFPQEGGPYVWTKLAFGRFIGSTATFFYWVTNPMWIGGTLCITAVTTFGLFFTTLNGFWKYLFALAFIWVATLASIFSFRIGKWVPLIGAWARVILLSFFTLTVFIYGIKHGVHGFGAGAFKPTWAIFIAATPVLFFNFEGFELPSEAGEEMLDPQHDVPVNILRGGIGTIVMYAVPILAILLILPTDQITGLGGFIDSIKTVFTVYGGSVAHDGTATLTGVGKLLGDIAAIGFIWALVSSGTSWLMGGNRGFAVSAQDGAAPRSLGVISEKYGTPLNVGILGGVVSTITMILAYQLASGNANKYFSVVLGLTISATTISYCLIFPAVIKLRYSYGHIERPYRIPGKKVGVWIVGGLATFWALLATVQLLWPGILTPSTMASSLPSGFAGQRSQFELSQFIPLAVMMVIIVIFYVVGAPTRKGFDDQQAGAQEAPEVSSAPPT
jgi:amino acid transporter